MTTGALAAHPLRLPRCRGCGWRHLFIGLFIPALLSCEATSDGRPGSQAPQVGVPVCLGESLEPARHELEAATASAIDRIATFAARYGWQAATDEPFMDSVMIFDRKTDFDHALLGIAGMDITTELPATYCAALENRILLAVSPELYARNYPQGVEPGSYEKLLAHEIAHRLHERVLNGDEEAMGPIWFFEGFATYAADQFSESGLPHDTAAIWATVASTERGDYRLYAQAFRYFAARIALPELIAHAGQADFPEWLRRSVETSAVAAQ